MAFQRSSLAFALVLQAIGSVSLPGMSRATWPSDPNVNVPICTSENDQQHPTIVSDGVGGAIVTWQDRRNGGWDIYVQRVSAAGVPLWDMDGVALCTAANDQILPKIASDGAGGAIVVWMDDRSGNSDVFAQRVGPDGAPLWATNGVQACTKPAVRFYPEIAGDGSSGAIIVWEWGDPWRLLHVQRISAAGVPQWGADGVVLSIATAGHPGPTPQGAAAIISDQAGGAIVTWEENRYGPPGHDIFAQRVDAGGGLRWSSDDVVLCSVINEQTNPRMGSDGAGGAIVAWEDLRSFNYDIFAQRVTAAGVPLWTSTSGAPLCQAAGAQLSPALVSDGAIAAWQDFRGSDDDIYAQRVNGAGEPQWTVDGVALSTAANDQQHPTIAPDGSGGAIVAWEDRRNGQSDIFTQRVSADGVPQWALDGVPLSNAPSDQLEPAFVSGGAGGAIAAWMDDRGPSFDIYADHTTAEGPVPTLLSLVSAEARPDRVLLKWFASEGAGLSARVDRRTSRTGWQRLGPVAISGSGVLTYEDQTVLAGERYAYRLEYGAASTRFSAEVWVDVPAALELELGGLRPNPAVGDLMVSFSLPDGETARLELFDVTGRVRLERDVGALGAGSHLVRLDSDTRVPAGLYWIRLAHGGQSRVVKALVVR